MCSVWCNNWVTRQHAWCNNENRTPYIVVILVIASIQLRCIMPNLTTTVSFHILSYALVIVDLVIRYSVLKQSTKLYVIFNTKIIGWWTLKYGCRTYVRTRCYEGWLSHVLSDCGSSQSGAVVFTSKRIPGATIFSEWSAYRSSRRWSTPSTSSKWPRVIIVIILERGKQT